MIISNISNLFIPRHYSPAANYNGELTSHFTHQYPFYYLAGRKSFARLNCNLQKLIIQVVKTQIISLNFKTMKAITTTT